jgi:Amidohydrolase
MWGSDYPHSESTFPQSRKILAEILAGVPDDEQAKIAGDNTARVYNFDVARVTVPPLRANLSAGRRARAVHRGRALPVLARGHLRTISWPAASGMMPSWGCVRPGHLHVSRLFTTDRR